MKIVSQNFCLGLLNKIDLARTWITKLDPDIFIVQEAEIRKNMDMSLFKVKNYSFYHTTNGEKSRLAIYVKSTIQKRIIISAQTETIILKTPGTEIVAIYRPFKIETNQKTYLEEMIRFIKENTDFSKQVMMIGDTNFDYAQKNNQGHTNYSMFQNWLSFTESNGCTQLINDYTWSRSIKGILKTSILDHVYSNDPEKTPTKIIDLLIGDHKAIVVHSNENAGTKKPKPENAMIRSWKNYSAESYRELLKNSNIKHLGKYTVEHANLLLNQTLMTNLHQIAPEKLIHKDEKSFIWSEKLVTLRRKKMNLLKKARRTKSGKMFEKCRKLDRNFRREVKMIKKRKIENLMQTHSGNTASFWKAVKISKGNLENETIPYKLVDGDLEAISNKEKAELFANYFDRKVTEAGNQTDCNVLHGHRFITHGKEREFGFTRKVISDALNALKSKTCFGVDRVPMRLLHDAKEILLEPIYELFNRIEVEGSIPSIWRISRIKPLLKKGDTEKVENYRPIANLCSIAKLYERCLLLRMEKVASDNKVDMTGVNQHGFKKGHSTTSLALKLQNKLANALDEKKLAITLSLDLSAAFDMVNHDMLLHRLKVYGFPKSIQDLIKDWLRERLAFVECGNQVSCMIKITKGTIQGSVLGPVLFALFLRPLLDIDQDVDVFADDNYVTKIGVNREEVKEALQVSADKIFKWLTGSGLVINIPKSELVIFSRKSNHEVKIKIDGYELTNKNEMKILGIIFDSKLTWQSHVDYTIKKVMSSIYGLRQLSKYIKQENMMQLATAFSYSKLYYGAAVWLNESLNKQAWKRINSVSASVIKSALGLYDWRISYNDLHEISGRANPMKMSKYYKATQLHNLLLVGVPNELAVELFDRLKIQERKQRLYCQNTAATKTGMNKFVNRLTNILSEIPIEWYEMSSGLYKTKIKNLFLK